MWPGLSRRSNPVVLHGCGDGGGGNHAGDPATRNRHGGGPTVHVAIDAFLDTPKIKDNPNTLRAYAGVLDRVADQLDANRSWPTSPMPRSATR